MSKYKLKSKIIDAITFDELVEYGKSHGGNIIDGMLWNFNYKDCPITHENDNCYLVPTLDGIGRMTPSDLLITHESGGIYPDKKDKYESISPDKCKWIDGKLKPCIGNPFWRYVEFSHGDNLINIQPDDSQPISFCPFCGADIRKPESAKPFIMKSGYTWIYEDEKGTNWLCIDPEHYCEDLDKVPMKNFKIGNDWDRWLAFTGETELTPEISKLWPKVEIELGQFSGGYCPDILVMVNDKCYVCAESGRLSKDTNVRLLTVKDLQELPK